MINNEMILKFSDCSPEGLIFAFGRYFVALECCIDWLNKGIVMNYDNRLVALLDVITDDRQPKVKIYDTDDFDYENTLTCLEFCQKAKHTEYVLER